jgi:hypothetical protein
MEISAIEACIGPVSDVVVTRRGMLMLPASDNDNDDPRLICLVRDARETPPWPQPMAGTP